MSEQTRIANPGMQIQANTWYRLTARVTLAGRVTVWQPVVGTRTARISRIRQAYARRKR